MADQSFVRTEMLPEQPAPLGQTGIIRWMREKLFSSIPDTVMTLLVIYVVYYVLNFLFHWGITPTWNSTSKRECFDAGIGHAACWGVIPERFNQLMFGFYPNDQQWRIIAAFILMFAAIAPVLFNKIPRKTLFISIAYPFVAFWLIWGDSLWGPIAAATGFAIAFFIIKYVNPMFGAIIGISAAVLAAIIWWMFIAVPLSGALANIIPLKLEIVGSRDIGGFTLSILIGISGIALSFPLGVVLALGRQSDMFIVKILSVGYIEFIRGVPLIVLLFVASTLLNYFLPSGTSFDLMLRVVILVTMFAAAYLAEVIRGGLAALPSGQYEAADALGLDYWKSMRLIIMPQALKISIPGIVSNFIGLFKDTTLVSIIGMSDPLGVIAFIRGDTAWIGTVWELFFFVAAVFWIFTFSMSRYSMYLERKLKTSH